jgi:hypothetical protein
MKDVFKEQLVKRRPDIKNTMAKAGLVSAAIFLMMIVALVEVLSFAFPILFIAIIFVTYILFRRFNIEYEYVLTNNELDIDIIYGESRRKRIFSASVRGFEAFRKAGSTEMEQSFSGANMKADYSSGPSGTAAKYEFVAAHKGKRMHIVFEPNEDLLSSIIPHLKRGTYPASISYRK